MNLLNETCPEDFSVLNKNKNSLRNRTIFVFIYIILVIVSEPMYRRVLFNASINVEINLQTLNPEIYKIFTNYGTLPIFFTTLGIFYLFYPLSITFSLFSVIIHASYWDNILKIVYGEARPYWISEDLKPALNMGFGNPSGHSMSSIAVYLSIWHIIIENKFFKNNFFLKVTLLFFFLIIAVMVILSRLVLAAHSINQVLYGALLGIAVYLVHFYLYEMHKKNAKDFFEIFLSYKNKIIFAIFYSSLIVIGMLFYLLIDNHRVIDEFKASKIYKDILKEHDIDDYKKFNEDGLYNALGISALIGSHLGLIIICKYIERNFLLDKIESINLWNQTNLKNKCFILVFGFIFSSPIWLYKIVPGSINLFCVFLFKITFPYLLSCFGLFGLNIWFCIKHNFCNEKIFEENKTDSFLGKV